MPPARKGSVATKQCTHCEETKPLDDFDYDTVHKRIRTWCKVCVKKTQHDQAYIDARLDEFWNEVREAGGVWRLVAKSPRARHGGDK